MTTSKSTTLGKTNELKPFLAITPLKYYSYKYGLVKGDTVATLSNGKSITRYTYEQALNDKQILVSFLTIKNEIEYKTLSITDSVYVEVECIRKSDLDVTYCEQKLIPFTDA